MRRYQGELEALTLASTFREGVFTDHQELLLPTSQWSLRECGVQTMRSGAWLGLLSRGRMKL